MQPLENQEKLFDFDTNKSLLVSDYDTRTRQFASGYEAIFNMVLAKLGRTYLR